MAHRVFKVKAKDTFSDVAERAKKSIVSKDDTAEFRFKGHRAFVDVRTNAAELLKNYEGESALHENELFFIDKLVKAFDSKDVWVSESFSCYCYLKWIHIYKFSDDPEPKRWRLVKRDSKGRYAYEIISILWKPHGAYEKEGVGVRRCYSDKYADEHVEHFAWDEKKEFEMHGYPCAKYSITEETMDRIIEYIKPIVKDYKP